MNEAPTLTSRDAASRRKKVWHAKTTTGCKTCKARKIKCDETRPICLRCKKSDRKCEGYVERKVWLFEYQSAGDHPPTPDSSSSGTSTRTSLEQGAHPNDEDLIGLTSPAAAGSRTQLRGRKRSSQDMLVVPRPLNGPYQHKEEQYFFKYFMEVTGPAIARSPLSKPFWLTAFPQVAWQLRGARYALLAMSKGFGEVSTDLFSHLATNQSRTEALDYESRAISSVVKDSLPVEATLTTSMALWMVSLITGDYARSLQHCYFTQKILRQLDDPQKYNPLVIRYCTLISKANLEYFRATRGPCPQHFSDDLLDCEASCFIPETQPLEVRVANTLFHLRQAESEFIAAQDLLTARTEPHVCSATILEILDKSLREMRFLNRRWSDPNHLKLSPDFERSAQPLIPFTGSPFKPLIDGLRNHIETDQAVSKSLLFLQVRILVTHPILCIDTSRGSFNMMSDLGFMLYHGSIWDKEMNSSDGLRENFLSLVTQDRTTEAAEEERSLWRAASELSLPPYPTP